MDDGSTRFVVCELLLRVMLTLDKGQNVDDYFEVRRTILERYVECG